MKHFIGEAFICRQLRKVPILLKIREQNIKKSWELLRIKDVTGGGVFLQEGRKRERWRLCYA